MVVARVARWRRRARRAGRRWLSVFVWSAQPDGPAAFYDPPAALPAGPPARSSARGGIDGAAPASRATRILYLSTDPAGTPIAVSGVVVTPDRRAARRRLAGDRLGARHERGRPPSAPSLLRRRRHCAACPSSTSCSPAGDVVVVTDYPGLGTPGPHPYLVGESEGRAVLDSVRAVHDLLGRAGAADATAIFGHSQGGHAAVCADALGGGVRAGAGRRRRGRDGAAERPGRAARRRQVRGGRHRAPGLAIAVVDRTSTRT